MNIYKYLKNKQTIISIIIIARIAGGYFLKNKSSEDEKYDTPRTSLSEI